MPQACVRARESHPPGAPNWAGRIDVATMRGRSLACSLGRASNHDFDGHPLPLRAKRRPTFVLEDEGAARVDGVCREDSLVGLACDRAGLATFSVDETNDRSAWSDRPGRPGRAGRPLLALFALRAGDLLLFTSRKR